MFGFATRETPEFMPLPIQLAHGLARRLAEVRKKGIVPFLRPDGKTQVSVQYADGRPPRVCAVVVAAQHEPDVTDKRIQEDILEEVVFKVIAEGQLDRGKIVVNPKESSRGMNELVPIHINGTGRFVKGGPHADTGMTGRKIIVDTYGGYAQHGGGSFSGKDPTKVDRSASYAVRHLARNIVAAGLADMCTIQVAYAIGVKEPVSLMVDTLGTGDDEKLTKRIIELSKAGGPTDMTPAGIIDRLDLRRPIYRQTATYGHFGRHEDGFTWERDDLVALLK